MPLVQIGSGSTNVASRRSFGDVLDIVSGPSAHGSTYWRRVLTCPFQHYLANILGWKTTAQSNALTTGLIWHHALEAFYQSRMQYQATCFGEDPAVDVYDPVFLYGDRAAAEVCAYQSVRPFQREDGYEAIWDTIERMLDTYLRRYSHDQWQILGVETEIHSQGPGGARSQGRFGFPYSARLDLIVVDYSLSEPVVRIIEHKSAFRLDFSVTEGYLQDLQTLGQVWLATTEIDFTKHPPFLGSIINVTSKTKTTQCERVTLQPSDTALQAWEDSMVQQAALLLVYGTLGYPKNYAHCTGKFGKCEFFSLCRGNPKLTAKDLAEIQPLEGYTCDRHWDKFRESCCPA